MRRLMLALAVVLAACGGSAPTSALTPAGPTEVPTPSPRAAADVPAILTATIDEVLCTVPAAKWCKYMKKTDGLYNIDATPGSITVQTLIPNTPAGLKLAAELCAALGLFHFDEEGVRLTYNHIHIFRGDTEQADCNAADY
jgi:hypothetical protein